MCPGLQGPSPATERGPRLLLDWVAEKLATRLNVNTAELPRPYTLNDVVCWFLAARGRREEAYVRLRSVIKDANFEPPTALRRPRVRQREPPPVPFSAPLWRKRLADSP